MSGGRAGTFHEPIEPQRNEGAQRSQVCVPPFLYGFSKGSWSQCASDCWRSRLPMNHHPGARTPRSRVSESWLRADEASALLPSSGPRGAMLESWKLREYPNAQLPASRPWCRGCPVAGPSDDAKEKVRFAGPNLAHPSRCECERFGEEMFPRVSTAVRAQSILWRAGRF